MLCKIFRCSFGLAFKVYEFYTTPSKFNKTRMTAITIKTWIQFPVRGKLGLMFRPKNPSSQRISRMTTMVHNQDFSFKQSQQGHNLILQPTHSIHIRQAGVWLPPPGGDCEGIRHCRYIVHLLFLNLYYHIFIGHTTAITTDPAFVFRGRRADAGHLQYIHKPVPISRKRYGVRGRAIYYKARPYTKHGRAAEKPEVDF